MHKQTILTLSIFTALLGIRRSYIEEALSSSVDNTVQSEIVFREL